MHRGHIRCRLARSGVRKHKPKPLRYRVTPRMAVIKQADNNKRQEGVGDQSRHTQSPPAGDERRHSHWREQSGRSSRLHKSPHDPVIPSLRRDPRKIKTWPDRNLYINEHGSIIHDRPKGKANPSVVRWVGRRAERRALCAGMRGHAREAALAHDSLWLQHEHVLREQAIRSGR